MTESDRKKGHDYQAMMRHLVEQAGECWHEYHEPFEAALNYSYCHKCNFLVWTKGTSNEFGGYVNPNPSPTDLNELVRLAEKLGIYVDLHIAYGEGSIAQVYKLNHFHIKEYADTPAIALLTALCKATGYKEEV